MSDETRDKALRHMQDLGLTSLAPFVRMLVKQYPFRDGKQWADEDMLRFAKMYAAKTSEPNLMRESEDNLLNNTLEHFKRHG